MVKTLSADIEAFLKSIDDDGENNQLKGEKNKKVGRKFSNFSEITLTIRPANSLR